MESGSRPQGSRLSSLALHGVVAAVIAVTAIVTRLQYSSGNCTSQLSEGRWVSSRWYPLHCVMHNFETSEVLHCLQRRGNVIVLGDQQAKLYYTVIRNAIAYGGQPWLQDLRRKEVFDNFFSSPGMKGVVEYRLHDYLDDEALGEYKTVVDRLNVHSQVVIHMPKQFHTQGLQGEQLVADCKANINRLIQAQRDLLQVASTVTPSPDSPPGKPPNRLLILQLSPSVYTRGAVSQRVQECEDYALRKYSLVQLNYTGIRYLKYPHPPRPSPRPSPRPRHDNSSTAKDLVPLGLNLVLNSFCNSEQNATCCMGHGRPYYRYAVIPTLIVILAIYSGVWLIFASGATFALTPHLEAISFDIKKFFLIFNSVGCLAAIFLFLLLVDRLDLLSRSNKFKSPFFLLVSVVGIIACGFSRSSTEKVEFMSREMTNEWKGWMILSLVAINYSGLDQVVPFNLLVQLLVGGFLFIAGYGHFMSFWNNADYSRGRIAKVLFELNALPVCACLTLGSPYGAYYLVVLLSASFLFVAAFMASWPSVSTGWLRGFSSPHTVMAVKFTAAFLIISLLPYVEVWLLPLLVRARGILESHDGCPYAIYYWFLAERYMTFWGMVFAYLVTMVRSNHYQVLSSQIRLLGGALSFLAVMVYTWYVLSARQWVEHTATDSHAYIAVLPLLAYIYLRSSLQGLHGSHSNILSALGRHSVWIYVSQFHLLLALNGTGHLTFFPGYDHLNALAVGIVYFFLVRVVMKCSDTLIEQFFSKPIVTFTV